LKAAREAKTETSWLTTNPEYEAAVTEFARGVFKNRVFVAELGRFCAAIERAGATNALAQTVLRLCVPGVPDTYQGSELWHQSLVDPDNRRPVDYERRTRYLAELEAKRVDLGALTRELMASYTDGRIKQFVIQSLLKLRKAKAELFLQGDYSALDAPPRSFAFLRTFAEDVLVCVVPRFSRVLVPDGSAFPVGPVWGEQVLRHVVAGRYRNVLTDEVLDVDAGGDVALRRVFASFPVAVLVKELG
jgi:(1->4)-alpha-D-glucan 1-alpha-D-glucosylmutase